MKRGMEMDDERWEDAYDASYDASYDAGILV